MAAKKKATRKRTKKKTPPRRPPKKAAPKKAAPKKRTTKKKAATKKRTAKKKADPEQLLRLAEPLTRAPPAPARLGPHGRECWIRITPLLVDLRLMSPLDLEALEAMCHQWQDYIYWQLAIQKKPALAIVEYDSGARQKSPEATFRDAAYDRWLRLLPRFGLSPEYLRKLKRLKAPASTGRSAGTQDAAADPLAAFAATKYDKE